MKFKGRFLKYWLFVGSLLMLQTYDGFAQGVPVPNVFDLAPNPLERAKSIYQSRTINPDNYTERFKKIEELFEQGEYNLVLDESKSVLLLDSTNERLLALMAESFRMTGDSASMFKYAQKLKYHHPFNTSAYVVPAVYHLQKNEIGKAESLLLEALKRDKNDSYTCYYMSIIEAEKANNKKAKQWIKKSLKHADNPFDAAMFYGYLLLNESKPNYRQALKYFELASMHDTKGVSNIYQGYCLYMLNQWDNASLPLKNFLNKVPDHPLSLMLMASIEAYRLNTDASMRYMRTLQAAIKNQQYFIKDAGLSEILDGLESMDEQSAAKRELLLALSDIFIYDDRCITSKIIDRYQSGIFYCEHFKTVLFSVIGFSGNDAKLGLEWLDRAYSCDTLSIFSNLLVSSLYIQMNNLEYGLFFNERAIEYGAKNFQVYYTAALLASKLEKYDRALELYNIAEPMQKENAPFHADYAACALVSGDSNLAFLQADLSVKLQPSFPGPYRLISGIYKSKGQFQKSLDYLDQAIHRGAIAMDYYRRAQLRDTLGFDANVEDDLKRAFDLDSGLLDAGYRLGLNSNKRKHYELAIRYWKSTAMQGHLPSFKALGELLLQVQDTPLWLLTINELITNAVLNQNEVLSIARQWVLEQQFFLANTIYKKVGEAVNLEYNDQAEVILSRLIFSEKDDFGNLINAISHDFRSKESFLVIKNLIALKERNVNTPPLSWPQKLESELTQSSFIPLARLLMQKLSISDEQMYVWAPWLRDPNP